MDVSSRGHSRQVPLGPKHKQPKRLYVQEEEQIEFGPNNLQCAPEQCDPITVALDADSHCSLNDLPCAADCDRCDGS